MIHSVLVLLDTLFPPTKHGLALQSCTPEKFITLCQPTKLGRNIYLTNYHQPYIQAAVAAAKFEHSFKASNLLRTLVTTWLGTLPPVPTLLIPIPLSSLRERERGYNQITRVINTIKLQTYPIKTTSKILVRNTHTKPQTSLGRTDRLQNMRGVFVVNTRHLPLLKNYKRIIICDDVTTTGATLDAARATLAPHIPADTELLCVAWAH